LSVAAAHDRSTRVLLIALAPRVTGAVGAMVSGSVVALATVE
jgi:hypothetical protein